MNTGTGVVNVGSLWVQRHGAPTGAKQSPDGRVPLSKDRHLSADGDEWKITHPVSPEGGRCGNRSGIILTFTRK